MPCCVNFRNRIKTLQERYKIRYFSESSSVESAGSISFDSPLKNAPRSADGNVKTLEKIFFPRSEIRTVDDEPYSNGALAKIAPGESEDKIKTEKYFYTRWKSHFFHALRKLDIFLKVR